MAEQIVRVPNRSHANRLFELEPVSTIHVGPPTRGPEANSFARNSSCSRARL